MKTKFLDKYTKEELQKVCIYTGLCKENDSLSILEIKQLISKNSKKIINKLTGGAPYASPFGASCAQQTSCFNPAPSYASPFSAFSAFASPSTLSTQPTLCDPSPYPSDMLPIKSSSGVSSASSSEITYESLYTRYQKSYNEYINQFKEFKPKSNDLYAKYYFSYIVLGNVFPLKPGECGNIVELNSGANASAFIYESTIGPLFVKIQKNSDDDRFDSLETDCIVSKLIRQLAESDKTFRNNHLTNFIPSMTSYILAPNNENISYIIRPVLNNTYYFKTLTLPALTGDCLVNILKRDSKTMRCNKENPIVIFYDSDNHNIITKEYNENNRITTTKISLADLLLDLFKSIEYLYDKIKFIHNDSHLRNIFYDRNLKKLILFDYGRSTFNCSKEALITRAESVSTASGSSSIPTTININEVAQSEVQKLNLKKLDGTDHVYPEDFLNSYSIYYNELDADKKDIPLFMCDIMSISLNLYRYFIERPSRFPNFKPYEFFNLKKIQVKNQFNDYEDKYMFCLKKIDDINNIKYESQSPLSLENVLKPGLQCLAYYIQNVEGNDRPYSMDDLCGGSYLSILLDNGVFNAMTFNPDILSTINNKIFINQDGGAPGSLGSPEEDKVLISNCKDKDIANIYKIQSPNKTTIRDIANSYKINEDETNIQFMTPNKPIPCDKMPACPMKKQNQIPTVATNTGASPIKPDNNYQELQQRYEERIKKLKCMLKPKTT